jgi:hypothetical protein
MATLAELYPDCVQNWIDPDDGELIGSVEYECVWRHIVRDGKKVISTKAELLSLVAKAPLVRYNEQDSNHALVKLKGKGWFALADEHPGLRTLARSLV